MQSLSNSLKLTLPMELYSDPYCGHRRRVLLLFSSILDKDSKFKEIEYDDQISILINLEQSCFDKTLAKCKELALYVDWSNTKFTYMYSLITSRVSKNLDKESEVGDNYLISLITSNDIDSALVAELTSEELSPSKTKEIKEKLDKRREQKLVQKTTSMYTCRNCKGRQCTMRTQQMRSLDEGYSIILNCLTCGYRFIVGG